MSIENTKWTTEALCRSNPDAPFVSGRAQRRFAKEVCQKCPVILECLALGLEGKEEFGVWGGLTARQLHAAYRDPGEYDGLVVAVNGKLADRERAS